MSNRDKICDFSMQNKGIGKIVLSLFINELFEKYQYEKNNIRY